MIAKWSAIATLIFFTLFISLACLTQEKAPLPTSVQPVPVVTPVAMSEWEKQWSEVIAGAKKEGRVVAIGTGASWAAPREALITNFKKRFGIELELMALPAAMVSEKIFRELKAGIYNMDVALIGPISAHLVFKPANILEPLEPYLILPEVREPKQWIGGKLNWVDSKKTMLSTGIAIQPMFVYNTNLATYEELSILGNLLNPKWKGKILMYDPTRPGTGMHGTQGIGTGPYGWDFLKELLNQEPLILADYRQMIDWVAQGKYYIALFMSPGIAKEMEKAGAPIKTVVPKDAAFVSAGGTVIGFLKNAPHPNAAKLFINWLFSREGQMIFVPLGGIASRRLDVPNKELLDSERAPDPNVKYRDIDEPEWVKNNIE